ncbi:alpha/beta fold hydrolase [Pedobacter sp. NJ-S-72]
MTDQKNAEFKHGMALIDSSLRIHYVDAGSGEKTIVLLHGFPQTWWEWRFIIPELVNAGFRVIAPEQTTGVLAIPGVLLLVMINVLWQVIFTRF